MSEDAGIYTVNSKLPQATLEQFGEPGYKHPCPEDVRALKQVSGKSDGELALLVGLKGGNRQFRKWTAPPDTSNSQQIPYSAWRLLLIELGIVSSSPIS